MVFGLCDYALEMVICGLLGYGVVMFRLILLCRLFGSGSKMFISSELVI